MKDTDCSELVTLRGRIDQVNRGILELLNERARLVLEVQAVKER
ncbi:MAG TPA: chorismate mutase, partial [Myxococcota bacterium]|nr:chorismate mutase [Myxococcota bacterium]